MYSLNVPVPPVAKRLSAELAPELTPFRTVRDRQTLVVKRFDTDASGARGGTGDAAEGTSLARLRERLRPLLADVRPFEARLTGIDAFERPPTGDGPVVYLAVESEGIRRVHARLVDEFGAVEGLEGDGYTPHVTLARGVGDDRDEAEAALERLRERDLGPAEWTVTELGIWTREYREFAARFRL